MAPPCRVFQAADLPHEVQFDQGKRRKPVLTQEEGFGTATPPPTTTAATTAAGTPTETKGRRQGAARIDLAACELFSMTQYDCQIDRPEISDSPVRCWPVQRWFRR